jgi:hypothetical protein
MRMKTVEVRLETVELDVAQWKEVDLALDG